METSSNTITKFKTVAANSKTAIKSPTNAVANASSCSISRTESVTTATSVNNVESTNVAAAAAAAVAKSPPTKMVKICFVDYPLVDIEKYTAMVVFGCGDGFADRACERLNKKYTFVEKYRRACGDTASTATAKRINVGQHIPIYVDRHDEYVCVFIVRKARGQPIEFAAIERCVLNLNQFVRKHQYRYVGIERITDEDYDEQNANADCDDIHSLNNKIITVFSHHLTNRVELYVCKSPSPSPSSSVTTTAYTNTNTNTNTRTHLNNTNVTTSKC